MQRYLRFSVLAIFLAGCVQPGIETNASIDAVITPSPSTPAMVTEVAFADDVPIATVTLAPTSPPLPTATEEPLSVNVATETDYPPFFMVDPGSGELTGFDIDMVKAIALKAHLSINFIIAEREDLLPGVSNCTYDAVIGHLILPDGEATVFSSIPYLEANLVMVARHEMPFTYSPEEIEDKQIGINTEFRDSEVVTDLGDQLVIYDDNKTMIDDLLTQRIDGAIMTYPVVQYYATQGGGGLILVDQLTSDQFYRIGVCPTNLELQARINRGIEAAAQDQLIEMIRRKWLEDQPMHVPTEAP